MCAQPSDMGSVQYGYRFSNIVTALNILCGAILTSLLLPQQA